MRIKTEIAKKMLGGFPELSNKLGKIKAEYVCLEVMSEEQFKTNRQNRLFHGLLSVFWESGCSSFENYDELRLYYKRVAGLVVKKGEFIREKSWADATKEQAKFTIDMLIRDMDYSGVIGSKSGKKYETILNYLGEVTQWQEK